MAQIMTRSYSGKSPDKKPALVLLNIQDVRQACIHVPAIQVEIIARQRFKTNTIFIPRMTETLPTSVHRCTMTKTASVPSKMVRLIRLKSKLVKSLLYGDTSGNNFAPSFQPALPPPAKPSF